MAFLRKTTEDGHIMEDAYSCFQKFVRRGDLENAVYWGYQIGKAYPNALRKRLMQHALEDVGSLEYAVKLLAVKKPVWDDLVPWVDVLCTMNKTRAAMWFNRVCVEYVADPKAAPTEILQRGAETLVLHHKQNLVEMSVLFEKSTVAVYKEVNKEVLALHLETLRKADIVPIEAVPECRPVEVQEGWLVKREVPEWAYDNHTARGKAAGHDYEHFFANMQLAPRRFTADPFEDEAKTLYLNCKEDVRHVLAAKLPKESKAPKAPKEPKAPKAPKAPKEPKAPKAPKEPKAPKALKEPKAPKAPKEPKGPVPATAPPAEYTNILQAQPLTSRNKPRVWFATAGDKQVVVKGPMKPKDREACMAAEAIKVKLGLPTTHLRESGDFLVQDCIIDYTTIPTRTVTTKLETDVRVPEKSFTLAWTDALLDTDTTLAMLESLLFRKVIGTNDTCARNFIVHSNTLYSIDDPALKKQTAHMWSKALKKPKEAYEAALARHWTQMECTIARWKEILADDTFAQERLNELSSADAWIW